MRSLLGWSSLVVALGLFGVGFAPLFGGPGYESALAAGLLVPPVAAVSTAWRVARARPAPLDALLLGATRGAWLGGVALATVLLHGVRVGFCSAREGFLHFALGPWCGALVAGLWGAVAGGLASRAVTPARRDAAAVLLALAGPTVSALVSGVRFLTSPMVFAFDPFVGFFSGTLYDTVIDGTDRLLSYRLGSLATWAAALGAAAHLPGLRPRGWLTAATAAAAAASLGVTLAGPTLGHFQTTASVRESLGGRRQGPFCEIVYPSATREQEVELFLRDCEQQLGAVSRYFEVPPEPVTAFLFADAGQKRRLMGAADTYIAKPWRREVYVQASGYPHPILGHELAHIVAGQAARGPFKVAGGLGGMLPDPGLVEGVAVAASPEDDELSPEAWSRAMLDLKLLPPLSSLFSLQFYAHDSGRAYTVAGAFVGWVRGRHGAGVVRRWYGGEALTTLTGLDWAGLERGFHEYLRSLELPGGALALARSRFDRPSVFQRRCPHEVDARKRDASALLGAGDLTRSLRALDEAAALAPKDPGLTLLRATCAERQGQLDASASLLRSLTGDEASRAIRDRADERLGDLALWRGDLAEARSRYEAVQARVLDEDHLRTLSIKLLAVADEAARPAVVSLLLGTPTRGADIASAVEDLTRWAERSPSDGVPLYLLGRNALQRGQLARGAELLDQALARGIALPRVAREAARQRVIAGCMALDRAAIDRGLSAWQGAGAPPGNRDALLRALASRCAP